MLLIDVVLLTMMMLFVRLFFVALLVAMLLIDITTVLDFLQIQNKTIQTSFIGRCHLQISRECTFLFFLPNSEPV